MSLLRTPPLIPPLVTSLVAPVVPASPFESPEPITPLVGASPASPLAKALPAILFSLPAASSFAPVASGTGVGVLDPDHLPTDFLAFEVGNGLVGLLLGAHLDEAEHAAVLEGPEEDVNDGPALIEERLQLLLGGLG